MGLVVIGAFTRFEYCTLRCLNVDVNVVILAMVGIEEKMDCHSVDYGSVSYGLIVFNLCKEIGQPDICFIYLFLLR